MKATEFMKKLLVALASVFVLIAANVANAQQAYYPYYGNYPAPVPNQYPVQPQIVHQPPQAVIIPRRSLPIIDNSSRDMCPRGTLIRYRDGRPIYCEPIAAPGDLWW